MTIFSGEIKGDVIFQKGDDATQLTSIGGSLDVRQGATCDVPQLTSIGGYPVPEPAVAAERLRKVAEAALAEPDRLNMKVCHDESKGCGTAHCIAGWAVHLEPDGYELEKKVGSTHVAGNILLGPDASRLFFLPDHVAREALQRVLDGQPALASCANRERTIMNTEQDRLYAIDLLNRAGVPGETRQIIDTAAIVALVERDIASWLEQQLTGAVSRTLVVSRLRSGLYRGAGDIS